MHQGRIATREVYHPKLGITKPEEIWLYEQSDACLFFWLKQRDRDRFDDRVALAKLERKWANEDGRTDTTAGADAAIVEALAKLAARLAAPPANAS
jgi:hypothetical protein